MPLVKQNLSVDFSLNNNYSGMSTKKIEFKSSLYAIDDIFNLKYFSAITTGRKSELNIATIKKEIEEKTNAELPKSNYYDFFDIKARRRAIIAEASDSELYGIRKKQKKLLIAIES